MFAIISVSIAQFFKALTKLFSAFEKSAGALDNLAGWSEDASGNFADIASIERKVKRFELLADAQNKATALGMTLDADLNATPKPVKVKAIAA